MTALGMTIRLLYFLFKLVVKAQEGLGQGSLPCLGDTPVSTMFTHQCETVTAWGAAQQPH